VFFLVIAAAIAPGFMVNEVFKENFGRARPRHIEEFNGQREFTGAFTMSDQCERNCSFSSGHAAMGYFLTAIAYTTNLLYFNRIYLAGIVFGSLVGLSRIVMGGHFLSDVLASAFVVLFLDHVIFILWQMLIRNLKK
jgi:lipid A 4'-phosphatase